MHACVLTTDIIGSTKLKKKELSQIRAIVDKEFKSIQKKHGKTRAFFEIYRGDSFQGLVLDVEKALKIAFLLKSAVNKINLENERLSRNRMVDFRMALGIGKIDSVPKNLKEAGGEAFLFSGRSLDTMKQKQQRTSLKTEFEDINHEFEVHFKFFDLLTERWSIAAAETVYYLLQDMTETQIAKKIGISQSAVNSRKKASGWEAVSKLLKRYEEVVSKNWPYVEASGQ
jgi:hypothetical protein